MSKKPKILLIGAGRFGRHHKRVLEKFHKEGKIELVGVVTKTTGPKLTTKLLNSVDAVDIVTPAETHFALAKKCLPRCHVFIEKPLAETYKKSEELVKLSKKYKKILMVGHIYRFHPVVHKLETLIKNIDPKTCRVEGKFISPESTWRRENPAFEKLHFFDIVDFLWDQKPTVVWSNNKPKIQKVDLRYPNGLNAHFDLGWQGEDVKERNITLITPKQTIECDFPAGTLKIKSGKKEKTIKCSLVPDPLERELDAFIQKLKGQKVEIPGGEIGARIVEVAEATIKNGFNKKPKIAIIGAGFFGTTTALHLSKIGEAHLFERHGDILTEASKGNQYRHHAGYHYPRSLETIAEIKEATDSFEKFYGGSVIKNFPAYYAISKKDSYTSPKEFLAVCDKMGLSYKKEYPPKEFLNKETVDLCIKTPEAVLDYEKIKKDIKNRLAKDTNIKVNLSSSVENIKLNDNGTKELSIKEKDKLKKEVFDIVVDATYINHNNFANWLNFPKKDLEFRLKELPIIKLSKDLPTTAIMIMDGPFATLVPFGKTGLYTFGDAPLSIHKIGVGEKALARFEKELNKTKTRWGAMKKRCHQWFPFLEEAEYIESMFVILPVEKVNIKNDARPTEVTNHGFGCFSILSGKIITSVKSAKEIRSILNH